jgi:nucleoside-diphosphate-sugar epimerase
MKILLTGSSGFIGQAITPKLTSLGEIHHLTSDLLDFPNIEAEVKAVNPDIIVHLAARTEVEKSFYEQITFSEVNYVGSVNLIESACKLPKLPYFVFASTMEVYGWQPISDDIKQGNIPEIIPAFNEATEPHPNAPYAVAKLGVEKYLEYANRAHELPYAIIRQTNAFGRHDNNFFVTEQIIWQMLTNPNECNLGYGEPYRNFIYVDDLINVWITLISNQTMCSGNVFTIGPDEPIQIKTHAKNIAELLNWQGTINWNTKPKRYGEIYLLNSSSTKLSELTGWYPATSYHEGLIKTINVWKNKLNNV